eukprot:2657772-Prymnesium_polylepis.1
MTRRMRCSAKRRIAERSTPGSAPSVSTCQRSMTSTSPISSSRLTDATRVYVVRALGLEPRNTSLVRPSG